MRSGEYLVISAGETAALEAVLHLPSSRPSPGVVVCHPHPLYGGDMDSHVVTALCAGLVAAGIAALRFNFGRGAGSDDEGRGEVDDAARALSFLATRPEIVGSEMAIAGYSFGGWIASGVNAPARACLAVSPPQLKPAAIPLLIITGDRDQVAPPSRLQEQVAERGLLQVIAGTDHYWGHGLDQAVQFGVAFLADHLR